MKNRINRGCFSIRPCHTNNNKLSRGKTIPNICQNSNKKMINILQILPHMVYYTFFKPISLFFFLLFPPSYFVIPARRFREISPLGGKAGIQLKHQHFILIRSLSVVSFQKGVNFLKRIKTILTQNPLANYQRLQIHLKT